MRQEYKIDDKLKAYAEFAEDNEHAVQLSFERSGRIWLASIMDMVMHETTHTYTHSLENKESKYLHSRCYIDTHLHDGLRFFDTAKYIFLIRDPRDSFRSWIEMAIHEGRRGLDIWTDKDVLRWMCHEWMSYFNSGVLDKDTLIVRYEDLCLRPVQTLEYITGHIEWIEPARKIDDVVCVWPDREKGFIEPDVDYYNLHCMKWKRVFTDGQSEYIFDLIGDTMFKYGYRRSGYDRHI